MLRRASSTPTRLVLDTVTASVVLLSLPNVYRQVCTLPYESMALLNRFAGGGTLPWVSYPEFSALLGSITLFTFGVERLLYETVGLSLGKLPVYLLSGIVLAVGLSSMHAAFHDRGIMTAMVLALGPVGGFAVYLIVYHVVFPPSSDSPTWLVVLIFAASFVALGGMAYFAGRVLASALSGTDQSPL